MTELHVVPENPELESKVIEWPKLAESISIATPEQHLAADEHLKAIKALRDEINETFDPAIAAANKAHKAIIAAKRRHDEPLVKADQIIRQKDLAYRQAEERKRRQEEERLAKLAREREEQRRLEEALELESSGDAEAAEAVLNEPIFAPVVHLQSTVQKVAGISTQTRYSAEVVNLLDLAKFVAANPQYLNYLQANTVALNAAARAQKEHMRIPGVRVVATEGLRVGGSR